MSIVGSFAKKSTVQAKQPTLPWRFFQRRPGGYLCASGDLFGMALAVQAIAGRDPDPLVGVFPSDHAIGDEAACLHAREGAERAAVGGYFALIGITPSGPASGYGYIVRKE